MARRALACVLALAPSRGQVSYPDLIFSGVCGDTLLFQKIGMTMGGGGGGAKPYYKAQTVELYMYYDPDCSGSGRGVGDWIVDTDRPDEGRWMDLDGDNLCRFYAYIVSSEHFPPMEATWTVFCAGVWEEWRVALTPVTPTSTSATGTTTTRSTTTTTRSVTSTTTTRTTTTTTTTTSRTSTGTSRTATGTTTRASTSSARTANTSTGIAAPATASGGSPALQTLGVVAAGTAGALAGLALLALAWCCWCRRSRHKVGVEPCRYHMPSAPPPSYWANQDVAGAGFESWEDVSEDVEAAIRQLLWDTFRDIPTQDRVAGKMPSGLDMVKVSRIENSRIWAKYARARDEIGARRPHACTPIGSVTGAAVRTQAQGAPMGRSLRQGVNEHHLFHGTSPRGAAAIAKHGFDLALAGTGAGCMFGRGVYTAECSSKADEYAQDDQGGLYRDVFCLLLCRVVLGEALVMTQGGAATIPIIHSAIESGAYESVVGNREAAVGTYREFVVYDDAQVYPEYAILYKRRFESPDGI